MYLQISAEKKAKIEQCAAEHEVLVMVQYFRPTKYTYYTVGERNLIRLAKVRYERPIVVFKIQYTLSDICTKLLKGGYVAERLIRERQQWKRWRNQKHTGNGSKTIVCSNSSYKVNCS